MEKMTNVKALAYVLASCDLPSDVAEKIENIKATYEKKSSGERKPTERQIANKAIEAKIAEYMEQGKLYTVTELMKIVPELDGLSNQRATAIVKGLEKAGVVTNIKDKRKSLFQLAE
jgi:DNA polymerase/3'-5' exonuclease PolX